MAAAYAHVSSTMKSMEHRPDSRFHFRQARTSNRLTWSERQQRQTDARFAGLALTARSIRSDQARRSAKARHLIPARILRAQCACAVSACVINGGVYRMRFCAAPFMLSFPYFISFFSLLRNDRI